MFNFQKYERRETVVTEEMKLWKAMSYSYTTEESDDPVNPNNLVIHKLPWRSDSEYRFICAVMLPLCCFICSFKTR